MFLLALVLFCTNKAANAHVVKLDSDEQISSKGPTNSSNSPPLSLVSVVTPSTPSTSQGNILASKLTFSHEKIDVSSPSMRRNAQPQQSEEHHNQFKSHPMHFPMKTRHHVFWNLLHALKENLWIKNAEHLATVQ